MSTPQPLAAQVSPLAIGLIGLRAAALALTLSGNGRAATALYVLADAAEAGKNIDAHMAAVGEKLKSRAATSTDWEEVAAAIEADSDKLQS